MVTDYTDRIAQYARNVPELYDAVRFAKRVQEENLPVGRYPVGNDFAFVQEGTTHSLQEGDFEVHRKYLDVQIVLSGGEVMEYADIRDLKEKVPYSEEKDVEFLEGTGSKILMTPGKFYLVYPGDGHKPCCHEEVSMNYKKVVVKIRINRLIHRVD